MSAAYAMLAGAGATAISLLSVFLGGTTLSAAPVTALAFSPDGAALVANGANAIEVRSTKDASLVKRIPCELAKITSIAFHPRGQFLAVAGGTPGQSGAVWLWDWPRQKVLERITNRNDVATCATFSSEGALLGVAGADHIARVLHVAGQGGPLVPAFTLIGHAGPVLALAFSPNGRLAVTASADRSIKVWSALDGKLQRTFTQHTEAVHALAFRPRAPGGEDTPLAYCASGGDDRTVRLWQPEIGRMVRIIRQHEGPIFALAFSPDGSALFSAGKEGIVRRLDSESDAVLNQWPAHTDWIYALAVSPDGSKLATGDWSGAVRMWDLVEKKADPVERGK